MYKKCHICCNISLSDAGAELYAVIDLNTLVQTDMFSMQVSVAVTNISSGDTFFKERTPPLKKRAVIVPYDKVILFFDRLSQVGQGLPKASLSRFCSRAETFLSILTAGTASA